MHIAELHASEYAEDPEVVVSVPGSVPLLGEHAEDSGGNVIAAGISLRLSVAVSFRRDASVRFYSVNLEERKRINVSALGYKREDRWANRPKSVLEALSEAGCEIRGMNVTIAGDIPTGIGLGSSAALLVSSAVAFSRLYGRPLEGRTVVDFCRSVPDSGERRLAQYETLLPASSRPGTLLRYNPFLDRAVTMPFSLDDLAFIITDSRVPRPSTDTEFKSRSDDVRKCLSLLGPKKNLRGLAGVSVDDLGGLMGMLPESTRRRCLFLIEEIERGVEAEDALKRSDLAALGKILGKSGQGLRNLYEVSCPEIDWLVKRALEIDGVMFSRMSGRGFGGCTVSLMTRAAFEHYERRLDEYERIFGFRTTVYDVGLDGGIITEGPGY
ncbi:MAG: galactokinase [Spirochaetes bacterium]|nr:galactokinase [Spirochaetota bacterium]